MATDEATARKWPAQAAYDVESPTGVILDRIGGSLCAPVQELRAWAEDHIDDIRGARDRYDSRDGDAR
jgi:DNA-binding HxlR family transcriptional regulator